MIIAGSKGVTFMAISGAFGAHPFVNFGISVDGRGGNLGAFFGRGGIFEI